MKNLTIAGPDISIDASESVNIKGFGTVVGFDGTVRGCHNEINVSLTSSRAVDYGGNWFAFGGVVGPPPSPTAATSQVRGYPPYAVPLF